MDGQLPTAFASDLDFFDSKAPIEWFNSPFFLLENPQIRCLKDNFFFVVISTWIFFVSSQFLLLKP